MRNHCASGRNGRKEPDKPGSSSAWGCSILGNHEDSDTDYGRPSERNHNQQGGVTYVKGMTSVKHHPKGGVVYIERKDEDCGPQAG